MRTLRKTVFLPILLLLSLRVMAPTREILTISIAGPIMPYTRIIHAIAMVETKGDTLAYNPVEQAVGVFQIRPIRLLDYNNRTGSHYKTKDLYSYKVSEKIFLYYAALAGPYDYEKIARNWNGSGRKTYYYWQRVKNQL